MTLGCDDNIYLPFGNKTDEQVINWLSEADFVVSRKLEDGSWVGIVRLLFTWAVCTDITEFSSYSYRWCFEDQTEAVIFYAQIVDHDDVPTHRESLKGHRYRTTPLLVEYDESGFPRW